jgi:uncharacterized protein YecE (DUF72 family)
MPHRAHARIHIGTSGWVYPHWVGPFYPPDLPEPRWLQFYAQHFQTVEINRSFYRLPGREQFAAWAAETQARRDIIFAVKASRYITHLKKLRGVEEGVARLVAAAEGLGDKLGPFLYQLPARWYANPARLAGFVALLPHQHAAAFEFRDSSWFAPEILRIVENAGCALVMAIGGTCPTPVDTPPLGPFGYFRFHNGAHGIGLSEDELVYWAERIARAADGRCEVYAYFNNDSDAHAVRNALRLRELLAAA